MERLAKLRLYGVTALLVTAIVVLLPVASSAGSVDSKVDVKIWGRAKFDMQMDTGMMAPTEFGSYLIDDSTDVVNFTPRDSRFGFSGGIAEGNWKAKAVVEIDFYGDTNGDNLIPRMRLGYADMAHESGFSMRGGQDWIPILQQNPATLDFGILAYGGNFWWRVPQLTFRYDLQGDTKLQFLLSFMKHRSVASDFWYRRDEKMPWIIGRIAWKGFLKDGGELAVGGGFRTVSFDIGDNKTQDYSPYLGALELNLPFAGKKVIVKGEGYVGAGTADEYLHYGFNYNPSHPDETDETKGRSIGTTGGFLSLTWNINPTWVIDVGGGMDDPKDEDLKVSDDYAMVVKYIQNTVLFGNVKMKMNKHCGIGFEVMSFDTKHFETTFITPATVSDYNKTYNVTGQRFTLSTWFIF